MNISQHSFCATSFYLNGALKTSVFSYVIELVAGSFYALPSTAGVSHYVIYPGESGGVLAQPPYPYLPKRIANSSFYVYLLY